MFNVEKECLQQLRLDSTLLRSQTLHYCGQLGVINNFRHLQ